MSTRRFADLESLVVSYLETTTGTRAVTELPEALDVAMPIYRVTGSGGSDDTLSDHARLMIESFAVLRADAADLAELARQAVRSMAHTMVSGWLIDTTETISRPTWIDYQNDHVQRFIATYEFTTRVRVS